MKKIALSFFLLMVSVNCFGLSNLVYYASAVKDKNKEIAEAIYALLDAKFKDKAKADFKNAFGEDPKPAATSLSLADREKLIKQASAQLQAKLQGKDLSNPDVLKEVLEFIGGPEGSGGILAKQIGQVATSQLTGALEKSAK